MDPVAVNLARSPKPVLPAAMAPTLRWGGGQLGDSG